MNPEAGAVLHEHVLELPESGDTGVEHPGHKRVEGLANQGLHERLQGLFAELVVERLVRDVLAGLRVVGPVDVGQTGGVAAERRHERHQKLEGADGTHALGQSGVACELLNGGAVEKLEKGGLGFAIVMSAQRSPR